MSPGWMRLPISSHTEMVMLPVLSATLQDLTSCPSLVLVTRPISSTIKTTFRFFNPGFMSFIKTYASLAALILRPEGGTGPAGDRAEPASRGAAAAEQGQGHRQPSHRAGTRHQGATKSLGGLLDPKRSLSPPTERHTPASHSRRARGSRN